MLPRAIWLACMSACGSPRAAQPAQSPVLVEVAPLDAGIEATPAPDAAAPDLSLLAAQVYAAIGAGHAADVAALVDGHSDTCMTTRGATLRRDGGFIVHGGRIALRLDARGAYESYRLLPACAAYVDEQVHVEETQDLLSLHGATAQAESIAGRSTGETFVDATDGWVLIANSDGEYVAWPRGAAKVVRSPVRAAPTDADDADAAPVNPPTIDEPSPPDPNRALQPRLAGRYLVTPTTKAIVLRRRDGSAVTVKGCKGFVLDAAPTPRGIALHVKTVSEGADTRLCMVNDRGITTHVTALGHAICGLAEAMSCQWEIRAVTSKLIVFSGLRGGEVVVDAVSGAKLRYRGEPDSQFPTEYSKCGDSVCVSTVNVKPEPNGEQLGRSGEIVLAGRGARYHSRPEPTPSAVEAVEAAWCTQADLIVPCSP